MFSHILIPLIFFSFLFFSSAQKKTLFLQLIYNISDLTSFQLNVLAC